ncbi:Fic family protein [Kineosphaera limosa]|uniref:Fido domain-containing protein n=1 Tax=Kineosphaera limosa NBRC 100340 TaxID=1184609 RepID=K6WX21_9MICO|nr:Fic family protein [Kineosphaera limosa]NYE01141.1 Fic family protein [Kineosphaera limosa]GAB98341.1 hypothetical protein KILIM_132_00020 [Kineosphaera limosa NBRC 100340]
MASLPSLFAVSYEECEWDEAPVPGMTRAERRHLGRPYRASVPARIADAGIELASALAADADEATIELARFDAGMGGELAPFSAVLLRSEAASSSQIENLSASARAITEAEITTGRGNAAVIVGNTAAMRAAIELSDRLDANAILQMHDALLRASAPRIAGRWRQEAVWIGGRGSTPHSADFVAPYHSRIPAAIDDLCAFLTRDDLPVLVQAAIGHAQFETIHPFPDGNGRTGRALAQAVLRAKGLTRLVTVPVSSGLLAARDDYYAALDAYRGGDVTPIVTSFADASRVAVDLGQMLVHDLRTVRDDHAQRLAGLRSDSAARRLAEGLFTHPVIDAGLAEQITGGTNVHRHIEALVRAGILVGRADHKTRGMLWRSPHILQALDDHAARVPRRRG